MTEGYIQVAPDSTGKQLDNDVVIIPPGTQISDNLGNITTLTAPAYYYRERIVLADPSDPRGAASVRNDVSGYANDYGGIVRLAPGSQEMQQLVSLLQDIDFNIAALAGNPPLSQSNPAPLQIANQVYPFVGIPPSYANGGNFPRPQASDIFGRILTVPYSSREGLATATLTLTGTGATTLIAAVGDNNTFNDIVALIVTNVSATATYVTLTDGTQSIVVAAPAGDTRGISLAGGPIIKQTSPQTAWTITANAAVTSLYIWALYVQNKGH